MPCISSIS